MGYLLAPLIAAGGMSALGSLAGPAAGAAGAGAAGAGLGAGAAGAGLGALHALPATADMMAATAPLVSPSAAGAAGAGAGPASLLQKIGGASNAGLSGMGKLNDPLSTIAALQQISRPPPMSTPSLNNQPANLPMSFPHQPPVALPGASGGPSSSSPNMQQLIQLLQRMQGGSGSKSVF